MAEGLAALTFERRSGDGRHGTGAAAARSVLVRAVCRLPLRVIRPFYLDESGAAYAVLVSPCGGLVGGDRMEVAVALGPGAAVCLSTQGATRVYRAADTRAVDQTLRFDLAEGASLEYLPEQTIPFAGSDLRQRTLVRLAKGATALLAEILAPGRLASGEAFAFRRYRSSLRVEVEGRPLLIDRVDLAGERAGDGASRPGGLLGPARLEGHLYSATLVIARGGPLPADLADDLHERLAAQPGVTGGASLPAPGLVTARLLASAHAPLAAALRAAWSTARARLFGLPPLDLRKL